MRNRAIVIAACAALAVSGCAKQGTAPTQGGSPSAAVANTTGLPLYEDATVIDSRQFQQTVDPAQDKQSPLSSLGKGTYAGHEVVASSTATVDDLNKWLAQQAAQPPQGYHTTAIPASITADAHRYGIDFVAFTAGTSKGATIVVMDPKLVSSKLGAVLTVLQQYNNMPEPLKRGMDTSIKQRTGWSISELTDPSGPLGAAIAAMQEFKGSDKRAIILVSAQKVQ